ncbi:hypothetical protein HY844_01535 [Candidatus Berkelbacteria bacterium]|nr:hypothetical protein [Candidatus Berkelbacteria bacterium]
MTEQLKDFWFGFITYGPFTSPGSYWVFIDAAVTTVFLFFILRFFNTIKGWRYIGSLTLVVVILIISSLFNLDALRLVLQILLIAHVIGLPVLFRSDWSQLLSPKETEIQKPLLGKAPIVIISLILGLILTIFSSGVNTKTAEFPQEIPIQLANLADGVSGDVGSQNTVKVIIRAPKDVWASLSADQFSASIDTAKRDQGTFDLPVLVSSKLSSVEILRTNPSKIIVSLQPVIKKTVTVGVKVTGKPANNLIADVSTSTPEKVEITGAKSVVNDINSVTAVIDVEGESTSPITKKVTLSALDSAGQTIPGIKISPTEVEVKVPLITSGSQKAVGISPDFSGTPAIGYWVSSISINPPVVLVTGSREIINDTTFLKTASINVNGLSANKTLKVNLVVPNGITLVDSTNSSVSVTVIISNIQSTKQITPQIEYSGLSSNLKVTSINPTSVAAVVRAQSSILNSLKESDVKLKLNLSSYQSAGTYTVNIISSDFVLIEGVSLTSFLPSAISVTLNNK